HRLAIYNKRYIGHNNCSLLKGSVSRRRANFKMTRKHGLSRKRPSLILKLSAPYWFKLNGVLAISMLVGANTSLCLFDHLVELVWEDAQRTADRSHRTFSQQTEAVPCHLTVNVVQCRDILRPSETLFG